MYIQFAYAVHLARGEARVEFARARLDFVDAPEVFEGPTFTYEDDKFDYGEERFVTLGLLRGIVMSIVHTETPRRIHIISFRKATKHEQAIFFKDL